MKAFHLLSSISNLAFHNSSVAEKPVTHLLSSISYLLSPICTLAALAATAARAANVLVEAETAVETEAPMVCVTNEVATGDVGHTASGGAWLSIPEKAGNPPKLEKGFAKFEVEIPSDGGWYLWARVLWDGECSNSFTIQIDDGAPFLFGEDTTFNVWHWVRYPVSRMAKPVTLSKGRHTIVFRNREDGVALDQFLLTTEKRYVPVGVAAP